MSFYSNFFMTGLGFLKALNGTLGFLTFVIGSYSSWRSDWRRKKLYESCLSFEKEVKCPKIGLEVFYVVIITIAFIISISILLTTFYKPKLWTKNWFKYTNVITDAVLCILIIASSSTLIYSAVEIEKVLENCGDIHGEFLTGGKIVAGLISLKLGLLHGTAALILLRRAKHGDEEAYLITD